MSVAVRHHLDKRADNLIAVSSGADDDLLGTADVAKWLNVSTQWLEIGRCKNYGPPFLRLSSRYVRYRRGDVRAWLQERTHRCTKEYLALV
jgi:hypothetical protein